MFTQNSLTPSACLVIFPNSQTFSLANSKTIIIMGSVSSSRIHSIILLTRGLVYEHRGQSATSESDLVFVFFFVVFFGAFFSSGLTSVLSFRSSDSELSLALLLSAPVLSAESVSPDFVVSLALNHKPLDSKCI